MDNKEKQITYYNIATDQVETLTQEIFDNYQNFIQQTIALNKAIDLDRLVLTENFSFSLAVYPNKTRTDAVFVAQEGSIEPYAGRTLGGKLCYPSVPQKGYRIPGLLPTEFACELVRRWNKKNGK